MSNKIKILLFLLMVCSVLPSWGQAYRVGDVYTAPDGSKGIVYHLFPDGSGGWVVALNDALPTMCSWGEVSDVVGVPNRALGTQNTQQLLGDTAGYSYTHAIRQVQSGNSYAAEVVDFNHGWYLPTPAQLRILFSSLPLIETAMVNAGGTVMYETFSGDNGGSYQASYWSSLEYSDEKAWEVNFYYGYMSPTNKTYTRFVRAVRTFTYTSDDDVIYSWSTGDTTSVISVAPTQTTTYSVIVSTHTGCSDAVQQTIVVNTPTTGDTTVTSCGSFVWHGRTFTESTDTATFRTTNAVGCDSITVLHLIVIDDRQAPTIVGQLANIVINGCDESDAPPTPAAISDLVQLGLTVSDNFTPVQDLIFSSHDSIEANDCGVVVYRTYYFTDSCGNTSSVMQQLTITKDSITMTDVPTSAVVYSREQAVSDSILLPIIYNACGEFVQPVSNGVDSSDFDGSTGDIIYNFIYNICDFHQYLFSFTYTVEPMTILDTIYEFSDSACESYQWNDSSYTRTGDYEQHFVNALGVDSTALLHLTIYHDTTVVITQNVCDWYQWHNTIYRQSGVFYWHGTTAHGCDSTEVLRLTVRKSSFSTLDSTVCSGDLPLVWNGITFTTSGRANATVSNAANCDSVILMNVTVKYNSYRDLYDTIVENRLPYDTLNLHFTESGTKMDTIPNAVGCDSVITFHLHVWPNVQSVESATACDSFVWHGRTFYESTDTATFRTTNALGCDSIVTLHLTVNHSVTAFVEATACDSFVWHGRTFYESTDTATFRTNSVSGCDSVVTLHLIVNPTVETVVHGEVIEGEEYIGNGFVVPADETVNVPDYHLSLQNTLVSVSGCDSVVTLELDIIVPPTPPDPPDPPDPPEPPQPEPPQPQPSEPEMLLSVMQLPNAITPSNSDGLNDFFGLPEEYIDKIGECEIIIFNRWGETVFYSDDKHFRWYGDYKGKVCKEQVFGYKMRLLNQDGILYRKKGSILVL